MMMTLADIEHLLPEGAMELMQMAQHIGMQLQAEGGMITDLGYCFPEKYAELVVNSPDGSRLEIRLRKL